jgi:hypothetical protein
MFVTAKERGEDGNGEGEMERGRYIYIERETERQRERDRERERDVRIKSYKFFRPGWDLNLRPLTKRANVLSVLPSETAIA